VRAIGEISERKVDTLCQAYEADYEMDSDLKKDGPRHASVREAARIELGLRAFLANGGFKGFTTTFEDLHGLVQLPGLAPQRLMADNYGFAGEGDWKTAALVRAMKVMASGLAGGTSFMEDYTYHLEAGNQLVLGAHMLEICPSIADGRASLQVHPLGIGGKADPARLVFSVPAGPALNASLMDFGNRFRLLINEVDCVAPEQPMPNLPVARAVWQCRPSFADACAAWIYAGGAHHTGFSQAVTTEMLEDFGAIAGLEVVVIDADTKLRQFKQELMWNDVAYGLKGGWVS
jgi:L-arabinose isomerase